MTKAPLRKSVLLSSLLVVLGAFPAAAAEEPLMIWTQPLGALLQLKGDATIRGQSPVPLFAEQAGLYDVRVSREGYETAHGSLLLRNRGGALRVGESFSLRHRRVFRSIALPGYGQMREGRPYAGGLWAVHTFSAAVTTLVLEGKYREAHDQFAEANALVARMAETGDEGVLAALHETYRLESNANRRLRDRNWGLGALALYWGLNLVDATFFHPAMDIREGSEGVAQITLAERTKRRAVVRSALYPGLGQSYLGRPFGGALYTALATAAGVTAVVSHLRYKGEVDRVETLDAEYTALTPIGAEEAETARLVLAERDGAVTRSEDDRDRRNTAVFVAAGVYLASIVDALLGAPAGPVEKEGGAEVGMLAPAGPGRAAFGVCWRF
ncbi:MAG: DUF5683 domain-containing protein [Candidatus Eisenbacteria bacterium]